MTKALVLISVIQMSCTLSFAQKSVSELQELLTGRWDITNASALVPKGADSLLNNIDSTEILTSANDVITFNSRSQFRVGESDKWGTVRFGNCSNYAGKDYYEVYLSGTKYTLSIMNDNHLFLIRSYEVGMSTSAELKKQ